MTYDVAVAGALMASWGVLGITAAAVIRAVGRSGPDASEARPPRAESETLLPALMGPPFGDRLDDAFVFDEPSRAALAACMFGPSRTEHIWWTILVVDPALQDTPSHLRLVGHYETEFEAMDAADQLATELNCCLLAGEAPLTTKPLGIEPGVATIRASDQVAHRPVRSRISPV